jgi:hypothetical protein
MNHCPLDHEGFKKKDGNLTPTIRPLEKREFGGSFDAELTETIA